MPVRKLLTLVPVAALSVTALSVAAQEAVRPPPPIPVPPVSVQPPFPPAGDPGNRSLMMWYPGEVRCGGEAAAGQVLRRPYNSLVYAGANSQPVTLRFAIDSTGRPHSIVNETSRNHFFQPQDIAAAFSASRFAPGPTRSGCTVVYTPRVVPLEEAPVDDLISYSVRPTSGALPQAGWERILGEGDCLKQPRPQPLLQGMPDFAQIAATPGVRDWALVQYDVDASGVPHVTGIRASTGNAELEQASREAMGNSRFTKVARTGCLYPYWRQPAVLPAPPLPEDPAMQATPNKCDGDIVSAVAARMRFPDAYQQRMIEGWAIVRYDVAPWGEVGNVTVLRAEPAEDFGNQAQTMLQGVTVGKRESGLSGCVQRVIFKMAPTDPSSTDSISESQIGG